jgi:hypothetical protein
MPREHYTQSFEVYVLKVMEECDLSRDMVAQGANINELRLARFLRGDYQAIYAVEYLRLCKYLASRLNLPIEWVINTTARGLGEPIHRKDEPHYMSHYKRHRGGK